MKKFLVLPLALLFWIVLSAHGCRPEMGKLAGKVEYRGVPCQPGQPDFNVPPCSGSYPNYEVQIFHVSKLDEPVLKIKTGPDGLFQVDLPAGDFIIYTQNGPFEKNKKENKFSIKPKESTTIQLMVNTGIL